MIVAHLILCKIRYLVHKSQTKCQLSVCVKAGQWSWPNILGSYPVIVNLHPSFLLIIANVVKKFPSVQACVIPKYTVVYKNTLYLFLHSASNFIDHFDTIKST